jgi:carbon-monoxide dehydrogenase medium subunit
MWHNYINATTLDEALRVLAERAPAARIIAGGTDLILELERGVRRGVESLVDVTRIPGLDGIALGADGYVHLGPLVTHNHCAVSPLLRQYGLPLALAAYEVGAPQIRNRGTVAGNIITGSPANDTITPLMALDARLTLRSARGERLVPLSAFYTGVRRTVMQPDEMLVDIAFPALQPGERGTFVKLGLRRAQAIAVVNAAAALAFAGDGAVKTARIALGAVTPVIVRAAAAEAFLAGKTLDEETIARAAELAVAAASPIDDVRGSAGYRREMVRVCVARGLRALSGGREALGLPAKPVTLWGAADYFRTPEANGSAHHLEGSVISATINGRVVEVAGGHEKTLLRWLREDAGLVGTKEGCAEGECGACTVFLDGAAVMSCLVPAPRAHGAGIVTVEGLAQGGALHPVQEAFVSEGAVQCGYCTPGFVMAAVKLLEERAAPTQAELRAAVTGNLCRCTGYYKILAAMHEAARRAQRAKE